uniref:Uncharacterized protein n=1 Tax=Anopheles minimus TaxID=112268 RepID=A0A182WQ82_9DIPT
MCPCVRVCVFFLQSVTGALVGSAVGVNRCWPKKVP